MGEEAYEEEGERCVIRTNPQLRIRPDEHFDRLFKPASKLLACKKSTMTPFYYRIPLEPLNSDTLRATVQSFTHLTSTRSLGL